jgi:hypothetical protein
MSPAMCWVRPQEGPGALLRLNSDVAVDEATPGEERVDCDRPRLELAKGPCVGWGDVILCS